MLSIIGQHIPQCFFLPNIILLWQKRCFLIVCYCFLYFDNFMIRLRPLIHFHSSKRLLRDTDSMSFGLCVCILCTTSRSSCALTYSHEAKVTAKAILTPTPPAGHPPKSRAALATATASPADYPDDFVRPPENDIRRGG